MPLKAPIEVTCDDCNGHYMIDGTSIDVDENSGSVCPYCGELNRFSLYVRQEYTVAGQ